MATPNKILMQQARESLRGKWGLAVGTYLLYSLIVGGASNLPYIGAHASLIIGGPMMLGMVMFSLALSRHHRARLKHLFKGFQRFWMALGTYMLMMLFVFLWMLLLIVPGIIAALSYSMTFYIQADDKTMGPFDALEKSKKMMYGYKWKYFCLQWRFFGWAMLSILTLGVGFLWLVPYIQVSKAKFYDDIKESVQTELKTEELVEAALTNTEGV
ncbi:MAG: DUF975 family protein [Bacteroidota bacterium]